MLPGRVSLSKTLQPTNANFSQAVRQPDCFQAVALRKSVHMWGVNARIGKVDTG